ncbi:MAG TPA: regulatory protein RecX [Polyangiaceae bacterium]|nr:regulatory protein RecX [Polyangiaceae bacterium]
MPTVDSAPERARRRSSATPDGATPDGLPPSTEAEGQRKRAGREPRAKDASWDEQRLHEAALGYLDRYDAPLAKLRRVLMSRLERSGGAELVDAHRDDLERVLVRLVGSGLVDDRRFAEGFAAQARRRGASTRKIEGKLLARGIASESISRSLSEAASDGLDELSAAREYVRKRRLLERDLRDPKEQQRALASLARQGFSFDVARRALELD